MSGTQPNTQHRGGPSGSHAPYRFGATTATQPAPGTRSTQPTPIRWPQASSQASSQLSQRALRLAAIIEASQQEELASSCSPKPSSSTKRAASPSLPSRQITSTPPPSSKKAKIVPTPLSSPIRQEAQNRAKVILDGYEEELNCPICCDLLLSAHVTNPCGHTCCAECGFKWIMRGKRKPTCAVCRTAIRPPLIPNLALDNVIDWHIQSLVANGEKEWAPGGERFKERAQRKRLWLIEKAKIEQAAERRQREVVAINIVSSAEEPIVVSDPDEESDESYETSEDEDRNEDEAEDSSAEDDGETHARGGVANGDDGQSRSRQVRRSRRIRQG